MEAQAIQPYQMIIPKMRALIRQKKLFSDNPIMMIDPDIAMQCISRCTKIDDNRWNIWNGLKKNKRYKTIVLKIEFFPYGLYLYFIFSAFAVIDLVKSSFYNCC